MASNNDDINTIFGIVDSDGSGYLDREKLHRICPHLSTAEIDAIFDDLDTDHDNRISLTEFTQGFRELIQPADEPHAAQRKKLVNQDRIFDMEEDVTTDATPKQINEVFSNLSWYESDPSPSLSEDEGQCDRFLSCALWRSTFSFSDVMMTTRVDIS